MPRVLVRGPAHRPFIDNWVRAAALASDATQLLKTGTELTWTKQNVGWDADRARVILDYSPMRSQLLRLGFGRSIVARSLRRAVLTQLGALPDLVHTHFATDAQLVTRFARTNGIRQVHTEHTGALLDPDRSLSAEAMKGLREVFDSSAVVIAVSEPQAEAIATVSSVANVVVVPNPVVVQNPGPVQRDAAAGGARIVWVGDFMTKKRPVLAVQALAALVHDVGVPAELMMIGTGPDLAAVQTTAAELEVSDRVLLPGQLIHDETLAHIAAADCLLHTSRSESFGMVIAEAALLGKRVVSTRCRGITDVLAGTDGLHLAEQTASALAGALATALSTGATAALREATHRYCSLEVVAETLAAVYRKALG